MERSKVQIKMLGSWERETHYKELVSEQGLDGWLWVGNAKVWRRDQPECGQNLKQGRVMSITTVLAGRTADH